jgi:hypothetical protein
MFRPIRTALIAAAVATAGVVAADTANAQWGYYGPSYYGGRSFSFGFSVGTPRYYAPSYGYYSGYAPYSHGYYNSPSYGAHSYPYYGSYYRPREFSYDVYSPYGRYDVDYRLRRDGSWRVDIDD